MERAIQASDRLRQAEPKKGQLFWSVYYAVSRQVPEGGWFARLSDDFFSLQSDGVDPDEAVEKVLEQWASIGR